MAVKKTKSNTKTKAKAKPTAKKKTTTNVKPVSKKAATTKKAAVKKKMTTKTAVKKVARKATAKPKAAGTTTAEEKTVANTVKEPKQKANTRKASAEKSMHSDETQQFATLKPGIPSFRKPSSHLVERRRPMKPRPVRTSHFSFMKAPGTDHEFEVGDNVEVFCDHDKSKERVRGWLKGIVVQVDNKMVAVQFRTNVYLTDGWMVPDRILWYPLASEHIRSLSSKKKAAKKEFLPDF